MAYSPRSIAVSDDEVAPLLGQANELLAVNDLGGARAVLDRAIAAQPRNQKIQSLLGMACFKLGHLDRAAELYELLVRENPVEPTLRVNLGLVYLKMANAPLAIREFQAGVDLAQRHEVHVVVDEYGTAEPLTDHLTYRKAVPPGHDRRYDGHAVAEADRTGHADPRTVDLVGQSLAAELAQQFDVHPNQIKQWKDQLLDGAADVFDDGRKETAEPVVDVKSLHAKIGELMLENDFLAGALGKAGLLSGKR